MVRVVLFVLFEWILMDFGGATTSEVFFSVLFPECVHLGKTLLGEYRPTARLDDLEDC